MSIRIAIVALALALLTIPASATGSWGSSWGSSWSSWGGGHSWSGGHGGHSWGGGWDHDWKKGDSHCWGDWGKNKKHHHTSGKKGKSGWGGGGTCDKGGKKSCKEKKNCDPPVNGVPTPTAALAGLAMMGLMLGRRRITK